MLGASDGIVSARPAVGSDGAYDGSKELAAGFVPLTAYILDVVKAVLGSPDGAGW